MDAAPERFGHDDPTPSTDHNDANADAPRRFRRVIPDDQDFGTFEGAVCLDIWYSVSMTVQSQARTVLKTIGGPSTRESPDCPKPPEK